MSIISSLREFLLTCPYFKNIPLAVDFLTSTENEAAIEPVPVSQEIKKYTDGGKICCYSFTVAMRFPWFADDDNGIRCSQWFEDFSAWLDDATENRRLPQLPEGMTAIAIRAVPNRFGFDGKNSLARYQVICNLTFLKEKKG